MKRHPALSVSIPHLCIVPPHMLEQIAQHGDAEQRARALRTLAVSERMRGRRQIAGSLRAAVPAGEKRRSVYDARGRYDLPGAMVRNEGSRPVRDARVNEAYDGAGETYDLYHDVYGRSSIDDRGMRLDSTVHYGHGYDNAFWDGAQMVYGDGDGRLFGPFTGCLDVIGHELSHGVIQHEAELEYRGQPGALNESFADVFGSLVKQRALGQSVQEADWIIGKGLFTPSVKGEGLRSLRAPGTAYDDPVLGRDPQPAHMRGYVRSEDDNGGVHINSGIPNHAFYRAAVAIGGKAWDKTGRIWYVALRDHLRFNTTFRGAASATLRAACELFGETSGEARATLAGWREVGVEPLEKSQMFVPGGAAEVRGSGSRAAARP